MERTKVKIIEATAISELQALAETEIAEGYRPIGGPFNFSTYVAWAFIKIPPPPPAPEPPEPTAEELAKAAMDGKTIVQRMPMGASGLGNVIS